MEDNKFFKFLWRINALVIAMAGLLAVAILAIAVPKFYNEIFWKPREHGSIVNVDEMSEIKEEWNLGYMDKIAGTPYVMIPLYSEQEYQQTYFSKGTSSQRNYLFVNIMTSKSYWLYKHNDYLISSQGMLSETKHDNINHVVRALLFHVTKEDSNGDKRLTARDDQSLALSKPDGSLYAEPVHGVREWLGHTVLDATKLAIIYQTHEGSFISHISLDDFTVLSTRPLAPQS